jgi:hypothetical protein
MTKTEAEKEVKGLNKKKPTWFCPLIIDMCRVDCVNHMSAFYYTEKPQTSPLVDTKRDDYIVQKPFCSNAMFLETELFCPHGEK